MADPWIAVGGLVVISGSESILYVSSNAFFNDRLASSERATLLSYSSMLFSLIMIGLFPLVGYLIGQWTYPIVVWGLAIIGALSLLLYRFWELTMKNTKNP